MARRHLNLLLILIFRSEGEPFSPSIINRSARRLLRQAEESEGAAFTIWLPLGDRLAFWFPRAEIEAAIEAAATEALKRLAREPISPGRLLASEGVPAELRSQAARSMLAMRGGRARAAKMRAVRYPNLVKAREALKRKGSNAAGALDPES